MPLRNKEQTLILVDISGTYTQSKRRYQTKPDYSKLLDSLLEVEDGYDPATLHAFANRTDVTSSFVSAIKRLGFEYHSGHHDQYLVTLTCLAMEATKNVHAGLALDTVYLVASDPRLVPLIEALGKLNIDVHVVAVEPHVALTRAAKYTHYIEKDGSLSSGTTENVKPHTPTIPTE